MKTKINRRSFVSGAALGASSILSGALNKAIAANAKDGSAQGPVANTTSGKIRGVVQENKVNAFRGIPYGAPTGGANRFMPPVKPEAWTGIKDTVEWGPEAPQGPHTEIPEVAATIPKLTISEDCLHLNVWTNGLDTHKRPVMVWLHGGGFTSGNGSYTMYDGANMARKHDVVTVTVNHRLNSFGFLYLADIGGAKYANARERRNAGHRRGAGMGARQHREFRRRSKQRDHLRPVGRRGQSQHAAGDASRQGPVPSRHRPERREREGRFQRRTQRKPPTR